MDFSKFFIDRPIFAAVLSIVIFAAGLISIPLLPIGEYPEVVPPSVVVRTVYPGANPKVIAETVATPLEEAIRGVEGLMYVKSVASSDGVLQVTVTFRPEVNADEATVRVQNRVSQALARLPEDVRRQGVTTQKQSPVFLMVVHLTSPSGKYDTLYLRNYLRLHVKDQLASIPGVGEAQPFGGGDYAMRIWLDPDKIASARHDRQRRAARRARAEHPGLRRPARRRTDAQRQRVPHTDQRARPTGEAGRVRRDRAQGRRQPAKWCACPTWPASSWPPATTPCVHDWTARTPPPSASSRRRAPTRCRSATKSSAAWTRRPRRFPPGIEYKSIYDTTVFVRDSIKSVVTTLLEATLLVVLVVILFLQTWRASIIPLIAVPVSVVGTFAALYLLGFSINTLTLFGLVLAIGIVVDDAIVVVENVERHIEDGATPLEAAHLAMKEVSGPIIAIALVLCAVFVPMAFLSGVTGQFYKQFAVTIAISTVISAINSLTLSPALAARLLKPHGAPKDAPDATDRSRLRLDLPSVQPLLRHQPPTATRTACPRCWAVAARCSWCTRACCSPPA